MSKQTSRSRPAASSAPDSPGVYDALLGASCVAVIMGIVMLCLELIQCNGKILG